MPLSPSMEQHLEEDGAAAAATTMTSSQDSLSSTGSNRDLKTQLDSTIAQVEAFAKEIIEKRKQSTVSLSPALEAGRDKADAAAGEVKQQRSVSIGGARPRLPAAKQEQQPKQKVSTGGVMLRESSWGSRDQALNVALSVPSSSSSSSSMSGGAAQPGGGKFAKNRSMWERKTAEESGRDGGGVAVAGSLSARGGAFRAKEKADNGNNGSAIVGQRQRQTPDLVLGLPVGQQRRQQQQQVSGATGARTLPKAEIPHPAPVPKPRTLGASAGTPPSSPEEDSPCSEELPAVRRRSPPSRSTSREQQPEESAAAALAPQQQQSRVSAMSTAMALRQRPLESAPAPASRPQVRVKPQVQSRRSPSQEEKK